MSESQVMERLMERLDLIERSVRPVVWIMGYGDLGRYIGSTDRKGRLAKNWAEKEKLYTKWINGTPHFNASDVDRIMRNGKAIITKSEKESTK